MDSSNIKPTFLHNRDNGHLIWTTNCVVF